MNKDYYVYLHRRRDNGVVFYIGKGRLSRNHTRIQRSSAWHEVNDAAGGFIVELLAENLSNSAAVDLENTYLRKPLPDWCLVNQAPSGQIEPCMQKILQIICTMIPQVRQDYDGSSDMQET